MEALGPGSTAAMPDVRVRELPGRTISCFKKAKCGYLSFLFHYYNLHVAVYPTSTQTPERIEMENKCEEKGIGNFDIL